MKPKKRYTGLIPFSKKSGNPICNWRVDVYSSYDDDWTNPDIVKKENIPFFSELRIDTFSRGRSAANFIFKDNNGIEYYMFMSDMLDILKSTTITNGAVSGMWEFCKKGTDYGLKYLGPKID